MKKLTIILVLILTVGISIAIYKEPIKESIYTQVTKDMFVNEDSDEFDPGALIGDPLPQLNATHKGQTINDLSDFSGPNGVILMASRSYDWCPYCMKQLIELEQQKAMFEQAGISLVAMTYDSPELQDTFAAKHNITIPILSDNDAQSFKALDILNADYPMGDDNYGLPYPGMFIVDNSGTIVGKLFVEAYSSRVNAKASFDYAKKALASNN
jgi:peroxiredoxin